MSIETTKSGRRRVRLFVNGKRQSFGTAATLDEAARLERKVVERIDREGLETLAVFGRKWIQQRERDGLRSAENYLGCWRTHVEGSPLGNTAAELVSKKLVEDWLRALMQKRTASRFQREAKPLSAKSIKCVLGVVRLVLGAARLTPNPFDELRELVKTATRAPAMHEPWTYLDDEEQRALMTSSAIPEPERLIISFAILTGLRQGEQFNLDLADVRVHDEAPHVVVRFGGKGRAPKNGRVRRVYLSPVGVDVVKRWLDVLPTWASSNAEGLAFPTRTGGRVCKGKTSFVRAEWDAERRRSRKVDTFPRVLAAAGITRRVRWHDLRHSCASALVAGWWGRRWTLDEVREHLGHTTVTMTARYAHLGDSAIKRAAAETVAPGARALPLPAARKTAEHRGLDRPGGSSAGGHSNRSTSLEIVYGAGTSAGSSTHVVLAELERIAAEVVGPLAARMRAALAAHQAGDPFAPAMMARLIEELLHGLPKNEPASTADAGGTR